MIVVDTDILSALAKVNRLPLLFALFQVPRVLSNESRVAHYCRQYQIACIRLPDILRALWVEGITSRQEVESIINDLRANDHMQFKQAVVDAIFADS